MLKSKSIYIELLIAASIILVVTALIQIKKSDTYIDVLYSHDWSHLSGADVSDKGVYITPLNKSIIHQDGSKAQHNPPINVRGPHLELSGNFEVKATMQGADDGASIQFYGQVPVIYDEWRHERKSIRIDASSKLVEARIWDGDSSTPMDIRSYNVDLNGEVSLFLKRENGVLYIQINGNTLGNMPDHNIFNDGKIWFGVDGNDKGDGWLLRDLGARLIGKGNLQVVAPPQLAVKHDDPDLLRNLADKLHRKIPIGSAVSVNPLFTDERYQNIAMSNFNLITLESSIKAQFIHPVPDKFDFTEAENIVAMAEANNQTVHGHTLVFAKSNPSWITDSPKEDLSKIMKDHVTGVVGHFKGRIASWDVVNEPLSEMDEDYQNGGLGLRTSFWKEAIGEKYIDQAFIAAHLADPSAKLYINDYGIEHEGQRWDAMLALIKRLKNRNVPIDGVGFESHVYDVKDKIDFAVMEKHMQAISDLGLSVRISEIDVTGTDQKFQSEQYSKALSLCIKMPNCESYTTWGISDLNGSTTVADRYPLLLGTSLLWDLNMNPKPAYKALQNTLRENANH